MLYDDEGIQVSSPEAEGSTISMIRDKRKLRVVDVIRVEEETVITTDIIHEMVDV